MTSADLWASWRLWMLVATVIIAVAAALLVTIWLTARSIAAHATRALRAAATAMMTVATSIHRRHAAQRSALVMAVLTCRASVDVVLPITRAVHAPEAVSLTGRPPGFLRGEVLPLAVEELDRLVGERLRLYVSPSAGNLCGDVPAVLAIGLAV